MYSHDKEKKPKKTEYHYVRKYFTFPSKQLLNLSNTHAYLHPIEINLGDFNLFSTCLL